MKKAARDKPTKKIILKCCFVIFVGIVIYNIFSSCYRVWQMQREYAEIEEKLEKQKIQNEAYEEQLTDPDALLSQAAKDRGYVNVGDQVYIIAN